MRKILLYMGIAIVAISCTKDADIDHSGESALTITSNIATRADKSAWVNKDAIGVYITDSTIGDNGENVEFTTTNGDGNFASEYPVYLPLSSTVDLLAYYPYSDAVDFDPKNYEIDSENQVDLLSAKEAGVGGSSSTVNMTFYHRLSKISLSIEAGDGLTTNDLDGLTAKLSNIYTSATFDLVNNVVNDDLDNNGSLDLTIVPTTTEGTTTITSGAIVIPQELDGATLYFTTKSHGTFSATLTTAAFTTGDKFTYTVTINRDDVEVSEANINAWDDSEESGTADIVDIEYKSDGKYYINSAKGLAAFRDLVNSAGNTTEAIFAGFEESAFESSNSSISVVLTRDIDLSDIYGEEIVTSWSPIGKNNALAFTGTFNGNGYKISELYIDSSSQQGLFGYLGKDGKVYNLGVLGDVKGYHADGSSQTAGIVAWNEGYVMNCYSEVNVEGETNVGGISGYNVGYVVNCYNRGDIDGTNNVGGIVGQNASGGYVGYCYSTGKIVGELRYGGVVGWNITTETDAPTIKGSFCLGDIESDYSIGQLEYLASSGGLTTNVCDEEYLTSEVFATIINNGSFTYNNNNPDSPIKACAWVDNSTSDYPTLDFDVVPDEIEWIYDIIYNSGTYDIYTDEGLLAFAAMVNGTGIPTIAEGSVLVTSGGDHFEYDEAQPYLDGSLFEDIDLGNEEWAPIGINSENQYTGTFNGNGYLVSGLSVSGYDAAGLFGSAGSGAEISNLGVDGSVSGNAFAGGVVGENHGTITNCYNTGSVESGNYAGGVVGGNNSGGIITNCYNTGSVSGDDYVGGVVGYNFSTLTNCYNTGDVKGEYDVGGVVGNNYDGTITNCYNTGSVESGNYAGGVVGGNNSGGIITNCYNAGDIDSNAHAGGVAGENYGSLTNCYWNSEIYEGNGVGFGFSSDDTEGMSTTEMKAADFVTTLNNNAYTYNEADPGVAACAWIAGSDGYPTLDFSGTPTYKADIAYNDDGIYEINTTNGLWAFANLVNGSSNTKNATTSGGDDYFDFSTANTSIDAILMVDVNLGGIDSEGNGIEGKEWTPIGTSIYYGTFDGGGHKVSGLYVAYNDQAGLFCTNNGLIGNLGVSGYVSGSNAGGIVGYNGNGGIIINCYNEATLKSSDTFAGGIASDSPWGSLIVNCYNLSDNITSKYAGGITASNNNSTIENCYNSGYITGTVSVGGIASSRFTGTITNCFYNSDIMSSDNGIGKTTKEMQAEDFAEGLTTYAASYNKTSDLSIKACKWIYNEGSYPTLDFGNIAE